MIKTEESKVMGKILPREHFTFKKLREERLNRITQLLLSSKQLLDIKNTESKSIFEIFKYVYEEINLSIGIDECVEKMISAINNYNKERCKTYPFFPCESVTYFLNPKMCENVGFMTEIVKYDPTALYNALIQTEDMVKESVKANPYSFVFAFDEFKKDRELCLELIKYSPISLIGIKEESGITLENVADIYNLDISNGEKDISIANDIAFALLNNSNLRFEFIMDKLYDLYKENQNTGLLLVASMKCYNLYSYVEGTPFYPREAVKISDCDIEDVYQKMLDDPQKLFTLLVNVENSKTNIQYQIDLNS